MGMPAGYLQSNHLWYTCTGKFISITKVRDRRNTIRWMKRSLSIQECALNWETLDKNFLWAISNIVLARVNSWFQMRACPLLLWQSTARVLLLRILVTAIVKLVVILDTYFSKLFWLNKITKVFGVNKSWELGVEKSTLPLIGSSWTNFTPGTGDFGAVVSEYANQYLKTVVCLPDVIILLVSIYRLTN